MYDECKEENCKNRADNASVHTRRREVLTESRCPKSLETNWARVNHKLKIFVKVLSFSGFC